VAQGQRIDDAGAAAATQAARQQFYIHASLLVKVVIYIVDAYLSAFRLIALFISL
jgi:hypothetical protein